MIIIFLFPKSGFFNNVNLLLPCLATKKFQNDETILNENIIIQIYIIASFYYNHPTLK